MEEKVFECEGGEFTLSEMLYANSSPELSPIDEQFVKRLLEVEVGEVIISDVDPNCPHVTRLK